MKSRCLSFILSLVLHAPFSSAFGHGGGTDSQGGHHDRKNGGYHFHHGHSAHQHPGGVCPYAPKPAAAPTRAPAKPVTQPKATVAEAPTALRHHTPSVRLDRIVHERAGGSRDSKFLTFHVIDLGAGDALMINTPADKKILIDAGWHFPDAWNDGDGGNPKAEYEAYMGKFWAGDEIDLMVLTHPDQDHYLGLTELICDPDVVIHEFWYNGMEPLAAGDLKGWQKTVPKYKKKLGDKFRSPLEDHYPIGSRYTIDDLGTPAKSDDVVITVINTQRTLPRTAYGSPNRKLSTAERRNSASIVLRLDYGATSILLTGDANGRDVNASNHGDDLYLCDDEELRMLDAHNLEDGPLYGMLDVDILKVAHHGSNGSSSLPFLQAVKPEWAVISAGAHHHHPRTETIERLSHPLVGMNRAHILSTDFGEEDDQDGDEMNLGDDCYQFVIDRLGVVRVEDWNVTL